MRISDAHKKIEEEIIILFLHSDANVSDFCSFKVLPDTKENNYSISFPYYIP